MSLYARHWPGGASICLRLCFTITFPTQTNRHASARRPQNSWFLTWTFKQINSGTKKWKYYMLDLLTAAHDHSSPQRLVNNYSPAASKEYSLVTTMWSRWENSPNIVYLLLESCHFRNYSKQQLYTITGRAGLRCLSALANLSNSTQVTLKMCLLRIFLSRQRMPSYPRLWKFNSSDESLPQSAILLDSRTLWICSLM